MRTELEDDSRTFVTALPANHCPGSAMFLFESQTDAGWKAVIVTGDIRSEPKMVDELARNPCISRYLHCAPVDTKGKGKEKEVEMHPDGGAVDHVIDNIYIDTSVTVDRGRIPKVSRTKSIRE